jgi:hypothetical protein
LVYGLGFGMLIVLFLVPSIVLIQKDFADLVKSFKRIFLTKRTSLLIKFIYTFSLISMSLVFFLMITLLTRTNFDFFNFQNFSYILVVAFLTLIFTALIIILFYPSKVLKKINSN